MNKSVIQLCGKISGLESHTAWELFNNDEERLRLQFPKAVIINPLRLCNPLTEAFAKNNKEPSWNYYMDLCLASLKHADTLAVMHNAHLSDGAKVELKRAFELGKEITPLEELLK